LHLIVGRRTLDSEAYLVRGKEAEVEIDEFHWIQSSGGKGLDLEHSIESGCCIHDALKIDGRSRLTIGRQRRWKSIEDWVKG